MKTDYYNSIYLFYALIIFETASSSVNNEQCSIHDKEQCQLSSFKYTEETNQIFNDISNALKDYKECSSKDSSACNCHQSTIENDLKPFQPQITEQNINAVVDRGTKYQIINHKLYRQKICMFPARCSGIEHFIIPILNELPNMEMIINCRDWPQIHKHFHTKADSTTELAPSPVFSFSKTNEYLDIMYPAWGFWKGGPAISLYPTGIGRWDVHREKISKAADQFQWHDKINKGFFRGSRTSDERDSLILLSRNKPNLVDAKYTKNQAWKSLKDTLNAEPAEEVSFEDHCKYKYLFNFRGVAASFRLKHLFLCKSLIFHVGNEWKEFFYNEMKPWVHYVPIESYPSQKKLETLIEFFQNHNQLAEEIAERGFQFIWQHLKMEDIQCYWKKLLLNYGQLLNYNIQLNESFIEIY